MKNTKKEITALQKRLERLGGNVVDLGKMPLALQKRIYKNKIEEEVGYRKRERKAKKQSKLMKGRWARLKKSNTNYGMKVRIRFNKNSPFGKFRDRESVYRNVTEIHYNYRNWHKFGGGRNESDVALHSVAFESDIHGTGITQQIGYIEEFETELEAKKENHF